MSIPCKFERSLLTHDEYEDIQVTHHPAILAIDQDGLLQVQARLRDMRNRERTLARQKRRDDLLALRDMETQLVELRARLGAALEREGEDPQPLREALDGARQASDSLLARLRERI